MVCIKRKKKRKLKKKKGTVDKRFWNKIKVVSQITGKIQTIQKSC